MHKLSEEVLNYLWQEWLAKNPAELEKLAGSADVNHTIQAASLEVRQQEPGSNDCAPFVLMFIQDWLTGMGCAHGAVKVLAGEH